MPDIQKFKMLDEIEHCLLRPARYIGSTSAHKTTTEVFNGSSFVPKELTYTPAFIKCFDEVISNSVDFSKTPEGKHVNEIQVIANKITGSISVWDNGGIPVMMHPDYNLWIPDMIFGHLRSGSNFDDSADSTSTGQNGEGASLTNIFSENFTVATADGTSKFNRVYHNNMQQADRIEITDFKGKFTRITYIPDYGRFNMFDLDEGAFQMIKRRCAEVKACNPHLLVKFNSEEIHIKSFEDYASMFGDEVVTDDQPNWMICISHSKTGFRHNSFVNSTATYTGGNHVDYVADKIVDRIRDHIEKKTKQKIKPSDIRNHFHLFINCTINNPRYDSQTKVNLITEVSGFGKGYAPGDKFIKKLLQSDMIRQIIEWAENKQLNDSQKDFDQTSKDKMKLLEIEKYEPAESDDRSKCTLFVMEGDSAKNTLMSARNPDFHGIFPLKGKPINAMEASSKDMLANEEFKNLMIILGLRLGVKAVVKDLRYQHMAISADNDLDGFHIFALMCSNFYRHWPELYEQGFVLRLETPLIIVHSGKKRMEFFDKRGFDLWQSTNTDKFTFAYKKGLGSHDTDEFVNYMNDSSYLSRVTVDKPEDVDSMSMAFSKSRAIDRKIWLFGEDFGK